MGRLIINRKSKKEKLFLWITGRKKIIKKPSHQAGHLVSPRELHVLAALWLGTGTLARRLYPKYRYTYKNKTS
jgi:hypothetical protein